MGRAGKRQLQVRGRHDHDHSVKRAFWSLGHVGLRAERGHPFRQTLSPAGFQTWLSAGFCSEMHSDLLAHSHQQQQQMDSVS